MAFPAEPSVFPLVAPVRFPSLVMDHLFCCLVSSAAICAVHFRYLSFSLKKQEVVVDRALALCPLLEICRFFGDQVHHPVPVCFPSLCLFLVGFGSDLVLPLPNGFIHAVFIGSKHAVAKVCVLLCRHIFCSPECFWLMCISCFDIFQQRLCPFAVRCGYPFFCLYINVCDRQWIIDSIRQ